MHIGVPAETRANEARVAAKPETVKKRVSQGHRVTVQSGAGLPASYINDAYATAGAELVDAKTAFPADIGPNVHAPSEAELVRQRADRYAGRLQYRKRRSLGRCRCYLICIGSRATYDGAKFVDVPFETDEERSAAEGVGGYARPMPASWLARQSAQVHERAMLADIVIATTLIPGRLAPTLLSVKTVKHMKPRSVIVALAAGRGPDYEGKKDGNCPLTEVDQAVMKHGVDVVGYTNLASMVAADASALYARNLLDFLKLIITKEGALDIDPADDIVIATLQSSGKDRSEFADCRHADSRRI